MAALVIGLSVHSHDGRRHLAHAHKTHGPRAVTRQVFGPRWKTAWCISFYESRHQLTARNGPNLGPWQINVPAHPWVNAYRLTHSWRYSATVAYRISGGGRDWSAWTTHALCGV